jgi:hypothetical protein
MYPSHLKEAQSCALLEQRGPQFPHINHILIHYNALSSTQNKITHITNVIP